MTFEEFENATDEELKAEAKNCFETSGGTWDRMTKHLLEAQFYMQELDRRGDAVERKHIRGIERRELILELIIIALILGEIVLGLWEGNQQAKALAAVETAARSTANMILLNRQPPPFILPPASSAAPKSSEGRKGRR